MADALLPPEDEASERTALLRNPSTSSGALSGIGPKSATATPLRKASVWSGDEDFVDQPWRRRPSVYWLIMPYALFTLAIGGILVPRLNLIVSLVCRRHFADRQKSGLSGWPASTVIPGADNPQCQTPEVQRGVAEFILAGSVIAGLLTAFTVPRLGALSDRIGRRAILAIASAGSIATELLSILIGKNPDTIHYRWLLAAFVAEGLTGSFTVGSVAGHSYTSDCTPPSRRTVAIGYIHGCLFAGMALGPLLSGYMVAWTGSLLSIFYAAAVVHFFFILYVLCILPESLSPRRQLVARQKHAVEQAARAAQYRDAISSEAEQAAGVGGSRTTWQRLRAPFQRLVVLVHHTANPLAPLRILVPKGAQNAPVRRNLVLLAVIDTLLLSTAMSMGAVTLLYSEFVFHWDNFQTSAFISLVSTVRVVVLMVIFPVINYVFRALPAARRRRLAGDTTPPPETNSGADTLDVWLVRAAVICDLIGLTGYIFVRTSALFALSGVVAALGGFGSATVQSSLTKHMPSDRVGQLLGAIGVLHSVARIVSPMLFNGLYAATVGVYPQAVFILITILFLFAFMLASFVRPHISLSEDNEDEEPAETSPSGSNAETDTLLAEDDAVLRI